MERAGLEAVLRSFAEGNRMSLDELARITQHLADGTDHVPTVAEFHARVEELERHRASWPKRRGLYRDLVDEFGDLRLDAVRKADVEAYAVRRRNAVLSREEQRQQRLEKRGLAGAPRRTGHGAQRNVIEAARRFFQVAVDDGLIASSPVAALTPVARPQRRARALRPGQLEELWHAVISGGDDPELDGLLVWFHLETGARRGGALGLRVRDIKADQCGVVLFEKGDRESAPQPISRQLLEALLHHAHRRGGGQPGDAVFHYRDSTPEQPHQLGRKRYETLYTRIRTGLPWARELWTRNHDLRHTAITMVERASGSTAVARLFARHSGTTTTDGYTTADLDELQEALGRYLGRPVGEDAATPDRRLEGA